MQRCVLILTAFILFTAGHAAIINVPPDYATIQEAIDAAQGGDRIIVNPGVYKENIDFLGKAVTVKSRAGPSLTIIDGMRLSSTVRFESGEGTDSVLDGFGITNGYGDGGGGIRCDNDAAPTIKNNWVYLNEAERYGGGIQIIRSSAVVTNNEIFDNVSGIYGGGVYCGTESKPLVSNNQVYNNLARDHGGGIFIRRCISLVQNNYVFANTAEDDGGGIYCVLETPAPSTLTNNTVFDNRAYNRGGGIHCDQNASPFITNQIVWNNHAAFDPQIGVLIGSNPVFTYCDIEGGWPGTGNIDADPLFVDPSGYDLHLPYDSPCRNSGDATAPALPQFDAEGDPRIAYNEADMGADEFFRHLYCKGDAVPGGAMETVLTGLPGSSPVGLWIGSGLLSPPLPSAFGPWYLQSPLVFFPLAPIPASGVEIVKWNVPHLTVPLVTVPMQGFITDHLTNHWFLIIVKP